MIFQNIQANRPVGVDIRVVYLGDEVAFGRSEGVVSGEVDIEEEDTSAIGTIIGANDSGLPMELVIFMRSSRAVGGGIFLEVSKFFLDSF